MNRFLFISFLFSLISCTKQENIYFTKFEVGKIKFEYPSDWKLTEIQGIDSYFSYLSKDNDTIYITYGMYNPKTYKNTIKDNLFKQITIDDREAIIETSQNEYGGFASIYIPKVDSLDGFYIFNKKGNSHEEVLDIYRTIKLGKSTRKIPLNFNFKEFTSKDSPPGIVIYENNCLSCHSEYNRIIGPALDQNFINSKGKNWIEKYIYSKKKLTTESVECIQIKDSLQMKEIAKYMFQK